MKVCVAMNNRRGNANLGTRTVEAVSTIEGLRAVLADPEVAKAFKERGYITAMAWTADDGAAVTDEEGRA